MEKTKAFQSLMKTLNYFDRILNRYQSLPRWYGRELLLYSSEADLLAAIGANEPITATELARMKVSTPSAISQTVKKLDAKGLLVRDAQDGDRRTVRLRLSDSGRQVYQMHRQREEARYSTYMKELTDYTPEDIARAAALVDFVTEKYLEEFRALDM